MGIHSDYRLIAQSVDPDDIEIWKHAPGSAHGVLMKQDKSYWTLVADAVLYARMAEREVDTYTHCKSTVCIGNRQTRINPKPTNT